MKHFEKQLPLKWHNFRERSNFHRIWFRDLKFRVWGLEIKHLKAHNFVWPWCHKSVFFPLISRNFDDRLNSNFHRFVMLCMLWDTPTVNTSLWQLPIVSSVFKQIVCKAFLWNWSQHSKNFRVKFDLDSSPVGLWVSMTLESVSKWHRNASN